MAHAVYLREKARSMRAERQFTIDELASGWLATRWICRPMEKTPTFSIQYHVDHLAELCAFWGKTLEIDPCTIKLLRKPNSNQLAGRSWRSRHVS